MKTVQISFWRIKPMKNAALHNLGCKVNSYETDVMQQKLEEKGYRIVPFDSKADVYIVNTCTVPSASHSPPGIGNGTVGAKLIAAVLYFNIHPGMLRRPRRKRGTELYPLTVKRMFILSIPVRSQILRTERAARCCTGQSS